MEITFADLALTLAAPALAALLVAWLLHGALQPDVAARWMLSAGGAVGFAVGYVLLPEWAPLWPDRHWMWLPYLGCLAAVAGAVAATSATQTWERLLIAAAVSSVAAVAIVPTWDTLQPARPIMLPLVAAYLTFLYAGLAGLPQGLQGATFTVVLAIAALGTASLVAYEVSVKFGQLGATGAAALIGVAACALVVWVRARSHAADNKSVALATSNRSLALLYAVAAGGLAYVAMIEPTEPAYVLLFAPIAPLLLWLFALPPLARLPGTSAVALQVIAVLAFLLLLTGWILLGAEAETDEWSAACRQFCLSTRLSA